MGGKRYRAVRTDDWQDRQLRVTKGDLDQIASTVFVFG
jgi:hypothetical protein